MPSLWLARRDPFTPCLCDDVWIGWEGNQLVAVTKDVDKAEPWAEGCLGELTGWKSGTRSLWQKPGQRLDYAARRGPGPGEDHEAQGHRWRTGGNPGGPRTPHCSHKCWGHRVGPVTQAVPREQKMRMCSRVLLTRQRGNQGVQALLLRGEYSGVGVVVTVPVSEHSPRCCPAPCERLSCVVCGFPLSKSS